VEEAEETVERFSTHTRAVSKGVQDLRNVFGQIRQARIGQSLWTSLCPFRLCGYPRNVQGRKAVIVLIIVIDHWETIGIRPNEWV
jgi:hypothetical protein